MSKKIPLTQGRFAIVDDEDFEYLNQWKWCFDKTGYARRSEGVSLGKIKNFSMHREINRTPKGLQTDHKNGEGLDNRRCNLRTATHSQNQQNRKHSHGISEFKGVCWHKILGKWNAYIRIKGKLKHLGFFENERKAATVYDTAARKYFGEFAMTNFKWSKLK